MFHNHDSLKISQSLTPTKHESVILKIFYPLRHSLPYILLLTYQCNAVCCQCHKYHNDSFKFIIKCSRFYWYAAFSLSDLPFTVYIHCCTCSHVLTTVVKYFYIHTQTYKGSHTKTYTHETFDRPYALSYVCIWKYLIISLMVYIYTYTTLGGEKVWKLDLKYKKHC